MDRVSDGGEAARIALLVAPLLAGLGLELVRCAVMGTQRRRLQLLIDRADGGSVTIAQCTSASRAVSALLDVEDPIAGAYDLEVGSPGIDRPLTRDKDFLRFVGATARLELTAALDGRRNWQGRLLGVEGGAVRLSLDGGEVALPLERIARARLTMSESLVGPKRPGGKRK